MINWSWLLLWSLVFPKVELESSRMSKTRRRRIGLRTKCWRFQTLPPNAVHLWLHFAFSGWTAHKTARKTCCFLCWAQSDCHKCSLVFMFPKKQVQKHSLRRRVEVFDSTTDPHWHVVIHEWVSGDMTWDHLKVGILKFRVINVSKDIDLTFRNLGKGWYEIHRYESRRLRISVSGVLWAEVLQRLQMQWFYQVPWQHQ